MPPPNLSAATLTAREVGSDYAGNLLTDGDRFLGQVTLDLCNATFPSEGLRTGRRQETYTRTAPELWVSNEVVTYVPGGAAQALGEVNTVARQCAGKPVTRQYSTDAVTTTITPLTVPGLLPGSVAVEINVLDKRGATVTHQETVFAVYQSSGTTLSAVYVHAIGPTAIASGRTLAARLALLCRTHLQAQALVA